MLTSSEKRWRQVDGSPAAAGSRCLCVRPMLPSCSRCDSVYLILMVCGGAAHLDLASTQHPGVHLLTQGLNPLIMMEPLIPATGPTEPRGSLSFHQ